MLPATPRRTIGRSRARAPERGDSAARAPLPVRTLPASSALPRRGCRRLAHSQRPAFARTRRLRQTPASPSPVASLRRESILERPPRHSQAGRGMEPVARAGPAFPDPAVRSAVVLPVGLAEHPSEVALAHPARRRRRRLATANWIRRRLVRRRCQRPTKRLRRPRCQTTASRSTAAWPTSTPTRRRPEPDTAKRRARDEANAARCRVQGPQLRVRACPTTTPPCPTARRAHATPAMRAASRPSAARMRAVRAAPIASRDVRARTRTTARPPQSPTRKRGTRTRPSETRSTPRTQSTGAAALASRRPKPSTIAGALHARARRTP